MSILDYIGTDEVENNKRLREIERMKRRMAGLKNIYRVLGYDVAQSVDYSAVVINEYDGLTHSIRHIQRMEPNTEYPDQVHLILQLLKHSHIDCVCLDASGVGRPVLDMLRKEHIRPVGIVISGGREATFKGRLWTVPKTDLVTTTILAFQNNLIRIAKLPETKILLNELNQYEITIAKNGHTGFSAPSGKHDDVIMALFLSIYSTLKLYRSSSFPLEDAKGFGGINLNEKQPLSHQELHDAAMMELRRRQNAHIRRK